MGFFTNLLNFEAQMGFYAAYHRNTVNKLIHIVCVPVIMWTVLVWLGPLPVPFSSSPTLKASTLVTMFYSSYYVLLEPVAGTMMVPLLIALNYGATVWAKQVPDAGMTALYIHIAAWIAQFIGHGVFEKRAPALFDSLVQALMLAPLFVWMEVLFLFGYRPQLRLRLAQQEQKTKEANKKPKQS